MPTTTKTQLLKMERITVGRLGNAYYVEGGEPGASYYPVLSTALWKAVDRLTVDSNISSLKQWAAILEEKLLAAIKASDAAAAKLDIAVRQAEQHKLDLSKLLDQPAKLKKAKK